MAPETNQSQPETVQLQAGAESPATEAQEVKSEFSKAFAEFSKDENAAPSQPSDGPGSAGAVETSKAPAGELKEGAAPGAEAKPAAAAETPPTTSPPPDKGDKPLDWSSVPSEFRAAYEAESAQRRTLDDQNRRLQQRRSAEGRERATRTRTTSTETPEGEKPPNGATQRLDKKTADELKADFPQLAPVVDGALEDRAELLAIKERLAAQDVESAETTLDANERELARRHSNWFELTNGKPGEVMGRWLLTQPQFVQDLARVNVHGIYDVDVADEVLSRYKASLKTQRPSESPAANPQQPTQGSSRRTRQLDGSATVTNRSPSVTHGVPNDFSGAFRHFSENPEAVP